MSHEQATRTPTAGVVDMKLDVVVLSHADHGIKVIAANPVMINAYKEGNPGNASLFPMAP